MLANTAAPAESEDFILKHVSCLRKVGMYLSFIQILLYFLVYHKE